MALTCESIEFAQALCLLSAMDWGSFRPYMPFLSAAIAALALYRLLESAFGITPTALFTIGVYGAALVATPLGFAYLISNQRQRNK
jgi:hypothetical protein